MCMSIEELQQVSGMSIVELRKALFINMSHLEQNELLFNLCLQIPYFRYMMEQCLINRLSASGICLRFVKAVKEAQEDKRQEIEQRRKEAAEYEIKAKRKRERITVTSCKHPK